MPNIAQVGDRGMGGGKCDVWRVDRQDFSLRDSIEEMPEPQFAKRLQVVWKEAQCWYRTGLQTDPVLLAQVTGGP